MHIEWNRVTWYSNLVAILLFVGTFWIAFNLGVLWEQKHLGEAVTPVSSSEEAAPVAGAGEHCGGFIKNAPTCAAGYHCQLVVSRPDTGGTCVKN